MWAYYNGADEAELYLNGKSQGVKSKTDDSFHVSWRLKFTPGSVKVITRKKGVEVMSQEIKTAGNPWQIKLTPDRMVINNDGTDLSFITVEILDKEGILCPNADNLIKFNITGNGAIVGVDNGNPISMESFVKPFRKAFNGKCLVVVKGDCKKGSIHLTATGDNLQSAKTEVKIR